MYIKVLLFLMCSIIVKQTESKYSSPCPKTFQYQKTQNGPLHGHISVYSHDNNRVKLEIEFSVANFVGSYNGDIKLASTKNQVPDDIRHGRPIRYELHFPQWTGTPPTMNKILLNGKIVCSGPQISGFVTIITLKHTLSFGANPFSENPTFEKTFLDNHAFWRAQSIPTYMRFEENPTFWGEPIPTTTINTDYATQTPTTIEQTTPYRKQTTVRRKKTKPKCGQPKVPNLLVVHGDAIQRGAFPWIVAIFDVTQNGLEYKCGGTLISNRHIITAAHCVERGSRRVRAEKLTFMLGKMNLQRWSQLKGEQMMEAHKIIVHPDYEPYVSDADIAVVVLSTKIKRNKYIQPICLWAESDDLELVIGQKGTVVGWGRDETGALSTAEPKQTNLPIVSQEQCLRSSDHYQALGITSNRTFCAGDRSGSGPCNGDSGSGLVMKKQNTWYLRGIVSISLAKRDSNSTAVCDLSNYIVFTDVSKFKSWLSKFVF